MPPISDLVRDSKLETQFYREYTEHVYYVSGATPLERKVRKEERWERGGHIGEGAFGTVWLEKFMTKNGAVQHRAVKEIRKSAEKSRAVDYYRELEAIAKFSHQKYERCFVRSSGWYENDTSVFIAMEYFPYGDLQNYLSSPIPEREVQQITSQVLEGLSFMHDNAFAHRDLKPTNILVKSTGPDWWVKIGDFGISKRAEEGLTALRTLNGTLGFFAPEILVRLGVLDGDDLLIGKEYTMAVDIWSLGEIMFRALTGVRPFPTIKSLETYIKGISGFPVNVLQAHRVGTGGCDILMSLMAPIPADRLTAKEALGHIWIEPPKAHSASLGAEIQRSSSTTEKAIPSLEYPTTEASACWSTLDDTMLKLRSMTYLSSAEDSQIKRQPVQNTTNSSFITERTAENLKVEREILNAGAQAPEDDNHALFNKPLQSPNTQPGHLQTTVSLDTTLNQTPKAEEATRYLVKRQPVINAMAGSIKQTPLFSAAANGHESLIQILLDKGADIHAKNVGDGFMALHIATQGGHEKAVQVLLAMGADVNAKAKGGFTALHLAAQNGRVEIARLLLTKRPDVNMTAGSTKQTALYSAAGQGHDSVVQLLLDNGADIHARGATDGFMALHIAAQGGYEKAVQALLVMGADVDARTKDGWTALHLAAQNGHAGTAQLLLTKRPDVNMTAGSTKQTPLFSAAAQGRDRLVQLLLDNGADIHAKNVGDGFMALHIATQGGHEKAVRVLLAMGADVNAKAKGGFTALHSAAQNGYIEIARLLLTKRPDVNVTAGIIKQTPLYSAAGQGHDSLVQLLLDNGADIHAKSVTDGFMALHIAAQGGREKAVQVLLAMGAQVDAEAKDGWTALHLAAQNGHAGTARILLTNGPDINITASKIEQTPL